jgi:pilus assembly protein Flp/PilA
MQKIIAQAKRLVRDEEGATMVEYGLMVALIAIVCIAAVTSIGTQLKTVFSDIANNL